MDFVQLMNNEFCCTGIIPVNPYRFVASLPPEVNVPPESWLAEKSDEWRCLISSLRGVGVPEDAVGQTVKDILLKTRGQPTSAVFAEELSKVVHEQQITRRRVAVSRRINTKEHGEILTTESRFQAAVDKRSKPSKVKERAEKKPRGRPKTKT